MSDPNDIERIIEIAKREEWERIINKIEAMDKRHTVSFVLQVLKGG